MTNCEVTYLHPAAIWASMMVTTSVTRKQLLHICDYLPVCHLLSLDALRYGIEELGRVGPEALPGGQAGGELLP